ncbi:hypothetical protein FGG08_000669 [Glutinoglossum americanum]|uniref:Chromo domain-containing protein n=1 Tax=Glutinoglossum americanum TaxID=1670608 RepID=A0A9P8ICG6_9PEZI|nr:hypothetical protein FGG08_000669 [Glutinoglossum americanum]
MPPPIDIDSDSDESLAEIPARGSLRKEQQPVEVDEDEDDEADGEVDGEYVVEGIMDHVFDEDGILRLQVKWKGYDKPKDLTWEPESNLAYVYDVEYTIYPSGLRTFLTFHWHREDVQDMLEEYYQKIGGRPTSSKKSAGGKRSRDRNSGTPGSGRKSSKSRKTNDYSSAPTGSVSPPAKVERKHWEPPKGSWENDVQAVDTIEQDKRGLQVYLHWNNGRKSTHAIETAKKKCPMKLLDFYEQHLYFT